MNSLLLWATYGAIAGLPGEAPTLAQQVVLPPTDARPLLVVAPRDVERAAMIIEFGVGGVDDGVSSGITHLSQYVLLEASRRMSSARRTELVYGADATVEVTTGQLSCRFVVEGARGAFDDLAERLLRQILSPDLDRGAFKEAVRRMYHQDLGSTGIDEAALFSQAAMADYGFAESPDGDHTIMSNLTFGQVQAHIAKHFRPANATVVLAGGFSSPRLSKVVRSFRGGARRPEAERRTTVAGVHRMSARFEVRLVGLPAPLGTPEQAAAMRMLGVVLRARVQRRFRAAGVSYATEVSVLRRPWLQFLLITVPTYGDPSFPIERELNRLIGEIGAGDAFDEQAFERYQRILLHDVERVDATPIALATELAMGKGQVPWFDPAVVAAARAMTFAEFRAQIAPWASSERVAHVVLSPTEGRPKR
ncbi:MAG: insulinase family protein [Myxococcales bacterium]|nr:insulinase family protein [Myxococcales bacterium]